MMNNNENRNTEFEKLLKEKLDGLASSVDCFDKISRKAFPQAANDFEDDEYIVSDLENVTGKTRRFRFMPVMAAAAAIVLCLFFLPKNDGFMNFLYANIGKSDKKVFNEIVSEIKEETSNFNYICFDSTLDEYINSDVLITPLFSCPFEENEKNDMNVRIFVKMCGNIPTNQVYAVVYEGHYLDENFIAAADSKAKFTAEELKQLAGSLKPSYTNEILMYNNEFIRAEQSNLTDKDGNHITIAGFDYSCYYKNNSTTNLLNGMFAYYCLNDSGGNSAYYYDALMNFSNPEGKSEALDIFTPSEIYNAEEMWNNVVYFNGDSAAAETKLSAFVHTDIFSENGETAISQYPTLPDNAAPDEVCHESYITVSSNGGSTGTIKLPPFSRIYSSFRIYHPNFSDTYTYNIKGINEAAKIVYTSVTDNQAAELILQQQYEILEENLSRIQQEYEEADADEAEKEILRQQLMADTERAEAIEKQLADDQINNNQ